MWILITLIGLYLIISITCTIIHDGDTIDCFNPLKWYNALQGYFLMKIMPPHILEQIFIRLKSEKCQPCMAKGKCKFCQCHIPEKMYSFNSEDSYQDEDGFPDPQWGKIITNRKEYEQHRKNYPINIKIEYEQDKVQDEE